MSGSNNFKDVNRFLEKFLKISFSGCVLGVLVLLLTLSSNAVGVRAVADDLIKHAVTVHPFLICLMLWIVSGSVCLSNEKIYYGNLAKFIHAFDICIAKPLLDFFAHALTVSAGLLLVLGWSHYHEGVGIRCGQVSVVMLEGGLLALFGSLAVLGSLIVSDRIELNAGKTSYLSLPAISRKIYWLYVITFLLLTWRLYVSAQMPGTTESIIDKFLSPANYLGSHLCR